MKFIPTPEMISAAETLFKSMAFADMIRPIVLKYETEILAEGQWHIKPEYAAHSGDKIILAPKDSYLMSEEDLAKYYAKCKVARAAANLHVDHDDQCPLLVAEEMVRQAQRALIEEMSVLHNLTADKLLCAGLDKYNQYVDLCLKLLAPFVRSSNELMAEIKMPTA